MKKRDVIEPSDDYSYEFCPRCDANLTLQKGYRNDLSFWVCKGCGEMLINPDVEAEDDIAWICDKCGCMLNTQEGFIDNNGTFSCKKCGHINYIDSSEVYLTEEEYQSSLHDPYKGLTDQAVLSLSCYEEINSINGRSDIILVENQEDGRKYVKKYLKDYDISVYQYLLEHPVKNMPRFIELFEGQNCLIVIEEFIEGYTLNEILSEGTLEQGIALAMILDICTILSELHGMKQPIIHRDIKPSNIMISMEGELFLLDMNVAKWYNSDEIEDTRLFGTLHYAAPEQFGYGFSASSEKTDIYAVGILLNVMLTGKLPKEEKAEKSIWNIIEKCICFDPNDRYTAVELMNAIQEL